MGRGRGGTCCASLALAAAGQRLSALGLHDLCNLGKAGLGRPPLFPAAACACRGRRFSGAGRCVAFARIVVRPLGRRLVRRVWR